MHLTIAFALSLLANDSGVKFFEGSWNEVAAEAKKTNKLIFADFSTQW